jgi:hypothetical protein
MHYAHYVARRIVGSYPQRADAPWFAEVQGVGAGFRRPRFHVARAEAGPATRVKAGDTIWIFGQLGSPWGVLPPALDARIEVVRVERRDGGRLRFVAGPGSRWFPLADGSRVLAGLETVDRTGAVGPLWPDRGRPIGQLLQSVRALPDADGLASWERQLGRYPLQFVSYRIRDGTRAAFFHVRALLAKRRAAVFWDRWSLPRRLAERRELVADSALDAYLMGVLRRASRVWGIESPLYGAPGSYSSKERDLARRLKRYRPLRG